MKGDRGFSNWIGDFLIKLGFKLFDRGSSNLVRDFLIELGIQVTRSGIP